MNVLGIDTGALTEAIGLAKEGFGLVKEAGGAAGKLRDLVSKPKEKPADIDTLTMAADLAYKLVSAQVAQSQMMNRLLELEKSTSYVRQVSNLGTPSRLRCDRCIRDVGSELHRTEPAACGHV